MSCSHRFSPLIYCLIVLAAAALTAPAHADEVIHNKPFSYFGIGYEFINYRENITLSGQDLKMDVTFANPVQRSGAYIPFDQRYGVYLGSSATLRSSAAGETWNYPGVGAIQADDTKFSWYELNITGAYNLAPAHQLTGGFDYYSLKFTRYNFRSASGTDAFNTQVVQVPTYADWESQGNDPRTYPGLRPENNMNTIVEDVTSLDIAVGYRYDSFFSSPEGPWRLMAGIRAGVPVYYNVENTQLPGTSFTGSVSKGYNIGADAGISWNFSKNFSLFGRVDYNLKHRDQIDKGSSSIPETRVMSTQTTLGLNWAF